MRPRQLRPLAIGEIVDAALRLVQRNLRPLALIALVVVLPAQIAQHALRAALSFNDVDVERDFAGNVHLVGMSWGRLAFVLGVLVVVAVVQAIFATAACTHAAMLAYVDCETPRPRESLAATLRRSHSLLWLAVRLLLVLVIVIPVAGLAAVSSVFTLVPAIPVALAWIGLQFALAIPLLFVEGVRGRKAVKRVRRLLTQRITASLAVVLVAAIPVVLVEVVSATALFAVGRISGRGDLIGAGAATLLGTVAGVLVYPLVAATIVVLYVDCRIRQEGFDVELAAERLGLEEPRRLFRPAPPPAPFVFRGGSTPPYWPPPPGWTPQEPTVPLRAPKVNPNLPPYWPPPPGWSPPATDGT